MMYHRGPLASDPFVLATSASSNTNKSDVPKISKNHSPKRSYATDADVYFEKFKRIPLPPIMHDTLDRLQSTDIRKQNAQNEEVSSRILVVGDVHGCLNELKSLVSKAICEQNEGKLFSAVVLVGDLCNKGPQSAEVIHYVRNQPNWYSVRGNHDNHALAAALGDKERCMRPTYKWVDSLSDDDILWMSNLPYTIKIPRKLLNESTSPDVIVVHAGFIPNAGLDDQDIQTMTTIRDIVSRPKTNNIENQTTSNYIYYKKSEGGDPKAWAEKWNGPELVIFGHDAKRGLQREEYAIGLDSGACYGKKLTGIVLPEQDLVSVNAEKIHCPIK